jgi:hypothetical protein
MNGQRRALIVATGRYKNAGLPALTAPASDAAALNEVLSDPQIGNFTVELVHDKDSSVIQEIVEDFLTKGRRDDLLLLHFSCHGLKDISGNLFFAARNTRLDRLESTAIPAVFLQRCLRNSLAGGKVVLLDCCYGGAFSSGFLARASDTVNVGDSFPGANGKGYAVITASSATEFAFEGGRFTEAGTPSPSVFTQVIVDGLQSGNADLDNDGWISLSDLYGYVCDHVPSRNPHQTPCQIGDIRGTFYLARTGRPSISSAALPRPWTTPETPGEATWPSYALMLWRNAGRARRDSYDRLYGDTGQGEDVQFAADRMWHPVARWRVPRLKALIIITDGKVDCIREVYGIDEDTTRDSPKVALRVSPPLKADEIAKRMPTLPVKLDDERPAVQGPHYKYLEF